VFTALLKAEREAYSGTERRIVTRRVLDAKLIELAKADDDDEG